MPGAVVGEPGEPGVFADQLVVELVAVAARQHCRAGQRAGRAARGGGGGQGGAGWSPRLRRFWLPCPTRCSPAAAVANRENRPITLRGCWSSHASSCPAVVTWAHWSKGPPRTVGAYQAANSS